MLEAASRGVTHGSKIAVEDKAVGNTMTKAERELLGSVAGAEHPGMNRHNDALLPESNAAMEQTVSNSHWGRGAGDDPVGQLLASMAADVEGPLSPEVFFERFVVFDPRRSKVRVWE